MKRTLILTVLFIFTVGIACKQQKLHYPETRKSDQTDNYFGTVVPDPYRWLENDTSAETEAWVKAENKVTFDYLSKIPFRDQIRERLTKIWNYTRMSSLRKEGGYYIYSKNDGLQNQSVYFLLDSLNGTPRVLIDPNTLSKDGTVALTSFAVSKDGQYLAYGTSSGGSDWREFFVKDIHTGKDLKDHLRWIKFSGVAWYGNGFFYSRYPVPEKGMELTAANANNKLYYHEVGTPQDQDKLIFEDPVHPDWSFYPQVTDDDQYLVISVTESTSGNALFIKNLKRKDSQVIRLVDQFDDDFYVIDHRNGKVYVMTNYQAPKFKLIAFDDHALAMNQAEDILPEHSDEVLTNVVFAGGKVIAGYLKDAHDVYRVYATDGSLIHEVGLPGIGSVGGFNGKWEDNTAFYGFSSFTFPGVVYRYDIDKNVSTVWFKPDIDVDLDQYVTEQVFYPSKDSTMIPMFIVHKKDMPLDGKHPTLLYGYGGFDISLTPYFSVTSLILLENGGVYAMANLRGGGEYGEAWHEAGTKMNKQNVFDDFIYAAKYLIDKKYTSPKYLACQGASNGGLLIGAVINQAPQLFRVAFPDVGVMDMLRYHKFTIGRYWASDYGTSEDSKEMFNYLYHYSPLHNIKAGLPYPAIMIATADHDDRVVPAHSFKYAATLQATYHGPNPILIRIETKAGHGGGKPTSKRIEEAADAFSFMFYNMGITPKD